VLKDGEVKELGGHDELMAQKGIYYTLNQLQFQDASS
jgi:ABC-type multidrug transport system fused ATPase/permease subunit